MNAKLQQTPVVAFWRSVNSILEASGQRQATLGEIRNFNMTAEPARVAKMIWNDRRP